MKKSQEHWFIKVNKFHQTKVFNKHKEVKKVNLVQNCDKFCL